MHTVSANFTTAIESNDRRIRVRGTFNSSDVLYGDSIIDIDIVSMTNSSRGVTMGDVCSNKLTMNLKKPTDLTIAKDDTVVIDVGVEIDNEFDDTNISFSYEDGYLYIDSDYSTDDIEFEIIDNELNVTTSGSFIYYDTVFFSIINDSYIISEAIEYVNKGTYYIDAIEDKKITNIVAYNRLYAELDKKYTTSRTSFPTSGKNILAEIEADLWGGATIFVNKNDFQYDNVSEAIKTSNYTFRQVIGYIFGLKGTNAYVGSDNLIYHKWYTDSGYTIARNQVYINGITKIGNDFIINSVSSGTADNVIYDGAGADYIEFNNPFITYGQVEAIVNNIYGDTFTPCTVKYRGNPALSAGDIVTVKDADDNSLTVYIMEHHLKISGGMYGEIKCYNGGDISL